MQIFEIFNSVNAKTFGYRTSESRAKETVERTPKYYDGNGVLVVLDYLPAREAYFVLNMRDMVKGSGYATEAEAQKAADWENMCNDYDAFRVVKNTVN